MINEIVLDPRYAVSAAYLVTMCFCLVNAILIWTFNPGNELRVGSRAWFHLAVTVFVTRRFVQRFRSGPSTWTWDEITFLAAAVFLMVTAIGLTVTITGQVERDRAERARLQAEAARRLDAKRQAR